MNSELRMFRIWLNFMPDPTFQNFGSISNQVCLNVIFNFGFTRIILYVTKIIVTTLCNVKIVSNSSSFQSATIHLLYNVHSTYILTKSWMLLVTSMAMMSRLDSEKMAGLSPGTKLKLLRGTRGSEQVNRERVVYSVGCHMN